MSDKSNFYPWIAVADKISKPLGGKDTFYTNLQPSLEIQSVLKIISEFYKGLIGIWQLLSHSECHNIELILSQNLWNNECITVIRMTSSSRDIYFHTTSRNQTKF